MPENDTPRLPQVSLRIMETVNEDMERDPQGFVNRWSKRIGEENPVMGKQLGWGMDHHPEGKKVATIAIAFYAMLTAQMEANYLENGLSEGSEM